MIGFRAAEQKDAHYLIDIDIKCFDYAWTPEEWRQVGKYCVACVATWNDTPVGMAIFYNDSRRQYRSREDRRQEPVSEAWASLDGCSTTAFFTPGVVRHAPCNGRAREQIAAG